MVISNGMKTWYTGYKDDKNIDNDVIFRYLKTISRNTAVEKGKSVSSAIYSLIGSITLIGIAVILTLLLSLLN
jgi:hypothetical protein